MMTNNFLIIVATFFAAVATRPLDTEIDGNTFFSTACIRDSESNLSKRSEMIMFESLLTPFAIKTKMEGYSFVHLSKLGYK